MSPAPSTGGGGGDACAYRLLEHDGTGAGLFECELPRHIAAHVLHALHELLEVVRVVMRGVSRGVPTAVGTGIEIAGVAR